jgi:hypothetical protein
MHVLGDVDALASHVNTLLGCSPVDRKPFPLQYLRRERGWSQNRVVSELQKAAADSGQKPPTTPQLQELVSGWEKGLAPSPYYRELLRIIFAKKPQGRRTASA